VDIGKRNCKACIMNSDGSIAEESVYNNTLAEAEIFAYSIVKKYGKCIAVCESTANLWKTYQAFEKYNIGVKLANPLKTKAIAEAKIKTDTIDARTLAHLLRSDLVAECYIASREIREDRSLLRLRTNLVQDRTRVMNRVHSLLDKYDVKCDYDNIFGVKGIRWLKSLKLSDNDKILLHEYVMQIEFLNTEIKNIESKITCEASKNESVKILMSMTGMDLTDLFMEILFDVEISQ
jgi:transposase